MNCTEIDELSGAFALGALPDDEAASLAAHLYDCAAGHPELARLEETAALLPLLCDPVEPPASLRYRILAGALADDERGQRALSRAVAESRAPVRIGDRVRRRTWQVPAVWTAAAALAVAVGLGAWNVGLHNQLGSRYNQGRSDQLADVLQRGRIVPLSGDQALQASVLVTPDGRAYLTGAMPAAPAGEVYEAWVISNGTPAPAGTVVGGAYVRMQLTAPLAGAQSVAVTAEPQGGSPRPTGPILATANLG